MAKELTIGDTNRDGSLRIVDTNWDSNGGLRVTVEDLLGDCRVGGVDVRAMRRLARRALVEYYPGQTRKSPAIYRTTTRAGTELVTFNVSRQRD